MDQQQQQNKRRAVDAGAGGAGQNHPPPQPCPRCNSNNTKFCYYNNYSLSQPRFFCKSCRRYWTHGGNLRNIPVGGGCRKSKRPKVSTPAAPHVPPVPPQQLAMNAHDSRLSSSFMANPITIGGASNGTGINTSTTMMMGHNLLGIAGSSSSSSGFVSPLNFGPNLGLFQGFGNLANLDQQGQRLMLQQFHLHQQQLQQHQQQHQQQNQEPQVPLQGLYVTREVGGSSSAAPQDWRLRMQPAPADPGANTTNNNNNNGSNNQAHQWPGFMGTGDLHDDE